MLLKVRQSPMSPRRFGKADGRPSHQASGPVAPAPAFGAEEVGMADGLGVFPLAIAVPIVGNAAGRAQARATEDGDIARCQETQYLVSVPVNDWVVGGQECARAAPI